MLSVETEGEVMEIFGTDLGIVAAGKLLLLGSNSRVGN